MSALKILLWVVILLQTVVLAAMYAHEYGHISTEWAFYVHLRIQIVSIILIFIIFPMLIWKIPLLTKKRKS